MKITSIPCFRRAYAPAYRLAVVGLFLVAISASALGQTEADRWCIVLRGRKSPINAQTTHADLVRLYGADNVVDQDIGVGEGETEPGTAIFPKNPKRTIEILWKDPKKKTSPASARIAGSISQWKTVHGISLGTSLKELEGFNGRPFHLAGLGWDYAGTVLSWDQGELRKDLGESEDNFGQVVVRLEAIAGSDVSEAEQLQVSGEHTYSSDHPVMQKLNPRVYEIIWVFPVSVKN